MFRISISRLSLVTAVLSSCVGSAASAQEQAATDANIEATQSKSGDNEASWSADVSVSALRSGLGMTDDEYGGAGYSVGGEIAYQQKLGDGRLRIEYESVLREFDNPTRDYQWRNRVSGQYRIEVDEDVYFAAEVGYGTNMSTVEARSSDQTMTQISLEYRPGDHRLRLRAGWRWREYDDGLGSDGSGARIVLDYRYKLGRNQFAGAELRYEEIASDLARYGFHRRTARAYYALPLGSRTSLRIESSLNWLQFDSRLIAGIGSANRKDFTITPELELHHEFDIGLYIQARTQYLLRKSTDPDYDPNSHRVSLTAGYRF